MAATLTFPPVLLAPIISRMFLLVLVLLALVPYQIAATRIRRALDLTVARTERSTSRTRRVMSLARLTRAKRAIAAIRIRRVMTLMAATLTLPLPLVLLAPIISRMFLLALVLLALVPYQIAATRIRRALDLVDAWTERITSRTHQETARARPKHAKRASVAMGIQRVTTLMAAALTFLLVSLAPII